MSHCELAGEVATRLDCRIKPVKRGGILHPFLQTIIEPYASIALKLSEDKMYFPKISMHFWHFPAVSVSI